MELYDLNKYHVEVLEDIITKGKIDYKVSFEINDRNYVSALLDLRDLGILKRKITKYKTKGIYFVSKNGRDLEKLIKEGNVEFDLS